jgi:hypothetical protein
MKPLAPVLGLVSLVAGPLCGEEVKWPDNKEVVVFPYYAGKAEYRYEGGNKAVYIKG